MILYMINFPCLAHPNDVVYSLVLKLKALVLMNWFICSYIWQRSSYLFHLVINFSSEQWEVHMNWSPCSISANLFDIKRKGRSKSSGSLFHSFYADIGIWYFLKTQTLPRKRGIDLGVLSKYISFGLIFGVFQLPWRSVEVRDILFFFA